MFFNLFSGSFYRIKTHQQKPISKKGPEEIKPNSSKKLTGSLRQSIKFHALTGVILLITKYTLLKK
jgi:hypothetical protein